MDEMQWIRIAAENLDTDETKVLRSGVKINVGLSPYEIPDGVRGYYDEKIKQFIIELKYIDDEEERRPIHQSEHITLMVGKHSGCLYGIHVDVDEIGANLVALRFFEKAGDAIKHLPTNERMAKHYKVVREALVQAEETLSAQN